MLDSGIDDDNVLASESSGAKIPVTAVVLDEDVAILIQKIEAIGRFEITLMSHDAMTPETSVGIVLFNIRMVDAFEDLTRIRAWRSARPLQPIIAISGNDDEDFMLEAFKSGATNYHSPMIPAPVLSEVLQSYYRMSEAPRMVEIQNAEMIRSMQSEREATEARLAAEGAMAVAEAQALANERTKEILDNLTEGFLIVEKNLVLADVVSKACIDIFGHDIASQPLGDILSLQPGREAYLRDGLDQLFEDFMPLEVNVSLLPTRVLTADGRTLSLAYHPILDASNAPEKVIIAAMDITAEVKDKAHLESLRAASEALLRILSEREAFEEFLGDTKRDIELLRTTDDVALGKRYLHTLKGNCSVMGLSEIATLIHEIENEYESSSSIAALYAYADMIDKAFEDFLEKNKKILGIDWHSTDLHVTFSSHDLEKISDFVRTAEGEGKAEALRILEETKLRTVHSMLSGFDEIAHQLGEKFGKAIEFQLVGGDLKLDPAVYGPLLKSLVHALRNACDHGIEDPEERERLGKAATGIITFKFEPQDDGLLKVTLSDSGRGIQIKKVLAKALANNIVSESEVDGLRVKDVLHLVFHDGLSTADAISETSGRGVGMACIRQEVEALGGSIRIASKAHKGTVFELNVPFSQSA